jgi:hypothetical protein
MGKQVAPHQLGQMTYGRAFAVAESASKVHAAVSHGLASSPPRGEAKHTLSGRHLRAR